MDTAVGTYICPMHSKVRQAQPGKCPDCGMDLVPDDARVGMLIHIAKNPLMLIAMVIVMIAIMAAAMKLM
jgi:hypothetical protein